MVGASQPAAGWYDDPDGSGGERYWDGERWTPQRRSKTDEFPTVLCCPNGHRSPADQQFCGECGEVLPRSGGEVIANFPPPFQQDLAYPNHRHKQRWKWIAGAIGVAVAAAALVAVSKNGADSTTSAQRGSGRTTESLASGSGSFDDWVGAVCRGGLAVQMNTRPVAKWACDSAHSGPGFRAKIFFSKYDSQAELDTVRDPDAVMFRIGVKGSHAKCSSTDGSVTIFHVNLSGIGSKKDATDLANQALQPLAALGCSVTQEDAYGSTSSTQQQPSSPPAPSPSATPTTLPGANEFQSPTGNIACHIANAGAACEIQEYDYTAPSPPAGCAKFGDRLGMDHGGPGWTSCHSTSFFGEALPTLPYDAEVTAGPITCRMDEESGVTCRDTVTGHFFRLSRQSYEVG